MSLVNIETYYIFPSIDLSNNVFRHSPVVEDEQRQRIEIIIPEGSYDLIDISQTIKNDMKGRGHVDENIKISANTNTLKSVPLFLVSIYSVLGFENRVY